MNGTNTTTATRIRLPSISVEVDPIFVVVKPVVVARKTFPGVSDRRRTLRGEVCIL